MVILVLISFIGIWIMVGNREREPNWRLALIQTFIFTGGYLVLATEILSIWDGITRLNLSFIWVLPVVVALVWGKLWLKRGKILRLPIIYHRHGCPGMMLDVFVVLILIMTALIAIFSPPNSQEALVTRMSRVAHWAQNRTLRHFPTSIETQNSYSPGAELVVLNFYVLSGKDQVVNLVAWLGFAGSVAAVASLAEMFGAKVNGQRVAAIFAASLPAAITQASGMMSDIVVAFWIVSTVLMLMAYIKASQKRFYLISAGVAASLAVLTQPIALLFLWPFALYMVFALQKQLGLDKTLLWGMVAMALLGLFNLGHLTRNKHTYGQFFHPVELSQQVNEVFSWGVLFSNVTRNTALHANIPFTATARLAESVLNTLHQGTGQNLSDPRTTIGGEFFLLIDPTSELSSGNPLHAAIMVVSFSVVIVMILAGQRHPDIIFYQGAILFSFLLFSYLLKWQPDGSRLQLPFFLLFSPMPALLFDRFEKYQLEAVIGAFLLILAIPWLFFTKERPVIPFEPLTHPVSIFQRDGSGLHFVNQPEDFSTYQAITEEIKNHGVNQIGLNLSISSAEYPFWALLGAPDQDLRIEWVAATTASSIYLRDDFIPGAIICEDCSQEDREQYAQAYEQISFGRFDLYIKDTQ